MYRQKFKDAISTKNKIRITFFSNEDSSLIARVCAPMDFGPLRRSKEKDDKYHMWDYESAKGPHTLSLSIIQVSLIEVLEESFNPMEFVTWQPNWIFPRSW
jgi:hypothetical protein